MMIITLVLLSSVVSFAKAQGECSGKRVEREEVLEDLEPMWLERPELDCSYEGIDAISREETRKYFFKGDYYWYLNKKSVGAGYPRLITQDWGGLPGHLDASLDWPDGRTFFFKGGLYWSFSGKIMEPGYPRNISDGFCGVPDNIDAALYSYEERNAYFFKGDSFWRLSASYEESFNEDRSTRYIRNLPNLPDDLDAALQWTPEVAYFFKGGQYYAYNREQHETEVHQLHELFGFTCDELLCRIRSSPSPHS